MTVDNRAESKQPLQGITDCIQYFRENERQRAQWKTGIEYELIGLFTDTLGALQYSGPTGASRLLQEFSQVGYDTLKDAGEPIAAVRDGSIITVEPGCQVEFSGRPFKNTLENAAELEQYMAELRKLSAPFGVRFLGVGYRPWGTLDNIEWSPKLRYRIMRPFLLSRGRWSEQTIAMTGSGQVSLDFDSEQTMGEMLRLSLAIQPFVAALYANSPLAEGRETGWKSYRLHLWTDVDPARCGLLRFAFEPGFIEDAYQRYCEWALDVPVMFVRRAGTYHEAGGKTFRAFMTEGINGERATRSDWEDHLTTLFPEVRVKRVIEVRAADGSNTAMMNALPALWKGILYDKEARARAWELVSAIPVDGRVTLMEEVARHALQARTPAGRSARDISKELVHIAADGLKNQIGFSGTPGEEALLAPLMEIAETGRCPADMALDAFRRGGESAVNRYWEVA
ncbi:glutamate--cysteine ligase [Stigmatella aurantiaca]|uniref:Glutamate--cysteine ligase n=1 Tax=Stigmatella aurantiaca (strain DW4/3-1) TaxID=378806 RepID=Q095N2_STIAD|nr:glutamate-cysteine ligase family protein [Stigmatella aurantiaca]ADO68340.1 Glutamate-cysteine ligase [Stigmatella aurantiaca DW4/3-1]EAU67423.1 glutamate-cysteine ligase [Stigmatella aurantiaca DW4/3-1]